MDLTKFFSAKGGSASGGQSKSFKVILWIIAALVVLLFVFAAGVKVGFKKASFSYRWGENYHKNFGGPRGGFFRDFSDRDFIDANGVSGQIINIEGQTLVIKGRDNVEKIVLVNETTVIRRGKETVRGVEFSLDDIVVAIGEPNDAGQIEAKFIRLMPTPPMRRSKK